jgi:hypothetical protein
MAKAHIKSDDGTQITIEGSPEEVASIVAKIRGPLSVRSRSAGLAHAEKLKKKEARKQRTASDLVASLKEEGFFDKAKRLGDISHKLEESGFMYPVTTLSGVMLSLVKKKILSRKKLDGAWVYGNR